MFIVMNIQPSPQGLIAYRSVLDPLVLNAPRKPRSGSGPTSLEPRILRFSGRFCHHLAQIRHRFKHHRLSRASEEHQGPTGMLTLITWWLAKYLSWSADPYGFKAILTYTTRWRLDLSIPPLKIDIASPVKPI